MDPFGPSTRFLLGGGVVGPSFPNEPTDNNDHFRGLPEFGLPEAHALRSFCIGKITLDWDSRRIPKDCRYAANYRVQSSELP